MIYTEKQLRYLHYKPSTVAQAKFDYSPLGKFFNKGLKEEDKKEELLKRLKNIEGKNEEQLKTIEDQEKNNNWKKLKTSRQTQNHQRWSVFLVD